LPSRLSAAELFHNVDLCGREQIGTHFVPFPAVDPHFSFEICDDYVMCTTAR
jgi:hypothetical protein